MGTVWAARNERTDRAFAVKFMLPQYAKDATLVQRFLNEARVCGRLEHISLVEIYDLGVAEEFGGAPFLVMELLRGEGLDALLLRMRRLDPRRVCPLILAVSQGLDLAHQAGIVHRDIKPANIFLHRDKKSGGEIVPKILDFGVSKTVGMSEAELALTRAGTLLGSPLYMSPEQARGQTDIDARSDVWALGVILYQAIAGVVPFNETNYNAVLAAILSHRHRRLNEVIPGLPDILSETVDLCLVKDRNRRMATAAQLAARLEDVLLFYEATEPAVPPSSWSLAHGPHTDRAPPPSGARQVDVPTAPRLPSAPQLREISDATEVMDRSLLPDAIRRELRAAGELKPEPVHEKDEIDVDVGEEALDGEESSSSRSVFLRRQWLADLAAAVNTAKTDDIVDVGDRASLSGESEGRIRRERIEHGIAVVEDVAEGNVAETDRAIRIAREALKRTSSPPSRPPRAPLSPLSQLLVVLGVVLTIAAAVVLVLMQR
jgi:serine/threonine protein kinase